MNPKNVLVPLPLAELLHCVLGPLAMELERDGHPWVPYIRYILKVYTTGRDRECVDRYGSDVMELVDICTDTVANELCDFLEMLSTEHDFRLWAEEMKDFWREQE